MGRRRKWWPRTSCPKCGAEPEQPCVTRTGNPASCAHEARPLQTAEDKAAIAEVRKRQDAERLARMVAIANARPNRPEPAPLLRQIQTFR